MMVGIELVRCRQTQQGFEAQQETGHRVCQAAMAYGVWIRPLGDVVVLMPPLSISLAELDQLTDAVCRAVVDVLGQ
jgi:adenosylmethionine-8-amino-7-oxononanoate aminotransferase